MSRAKSSSSGHDEAEAAGKLLRELADRAERDPAFGEQIAEAVRASGLLGAAQTAQKPPAPRKKSTASAKRQQPATTGELPDPFQVLRQHGEDGLHAELARLDLASLRQIVRAHRLDPARISARWTATDRVIALIVEQVRARANHGRAFERI
jgi:hypothetical protein